MKSAKRCPDANSRNACFCSSFCRCSSTVLSSFILFSVTPVAVSSTKKSPFFSTTKSPVGSTNFIPVLFFFIMLLIDVLVAVHRGPAQLIPCPEPSVGKSALFSYDSSDTPYAERMWNFCFSINSFVKFATLFPNPHFLQSALLRRVTILS